MVVFSPMRRRLLAVSMLLIGLCAAFSAAVEGASPAPKRPVAHAAASFLAGVADEQTEMFSDPLWRQLHTRITRYIVPYDAVAHPSSIGEARTWIRKAEAQHQQ